MPLLHSGATACMRKAGILLKHNLKMGIATAKCTLGKLYVTVRAKTRHVHTQTEIHFIASAYSYTK